MKTKHLFLALLGLSALSSPLSTAFAQGTAFTYQGRLNSGVNPATGVYDLRFAVVNDDNGGVPLGGWLTNSATLVSNGLFTVTLDFGNQFPGSPRWLEIAVRTNGGGAFATLVPRQRLTATPYAVFAGNAGVAASASSVLGLAVNTNLASVALGTGNAASAAFATVSGGTANTASAGYATVSGGTDNTASGERATVGGGHYNTASGDRSVVAGGYGNEASGYTAFVGAGLGNRASGNYATLGGGDNNVASGGISFVGGGSANQATNTFATVPGGENNLAGGQYSFASGRRAKALHDGAFVWADHQAADFTSTGADQFLIRASGGVGINTNNPSGAALAVKGNVTVDGQFKGGYSGNVISNGLVGGFIGGGGDPGFPNRVGGSYATVLGGLGNTASGLAAMAMGLYNTADGYVSLATGQESLASGDYSTAMGYKAAATRTAATALGYNTTASGIASTALGCFTTASGYYSTAMGYYTTSGEYSTAMGYRARALHNGSFVWADEQEADFDSTSRNQFSLRASGGVRLANDTSLNFGDQTRQMINLWNGEYGIGVQSGAGYFRSGGDFFWYRGGSHSDANGSAGGGGIPLMSLKSSGRLGLGTTTPDFPLDVLSGLAVGRFTTTNNANGAVLSLRNNTASPTYLGAINFEDSGTPGQIAYFASGQMAFRAGGQERMNLSAPGLTVNGTVTATAFNPASDRHLKENFAAVSPREVLAKVAALPISRWNFKGDPATPHFGPMAQDFHAAFGLGTDERHIATVDADGVALAAIQGLNQKLEHTQRENESLKERVEKLERLLQKLVNE